MEELLRQELHGRGVLVDWETEIEKLANQIRIDIVKMTYQSGIKGAHLGGSLSIADILAVLYGRIMKYDVQIPTMDTRDRLIISKAHAAVALYSALKQVGFLSQQDIDGAMCGNSKLYEHPTRSLENGIEFSGGSLGQGLSLGMGTALALKLKQNDKSRVFVILGDGECDEGQIWEAASAIVHYHLNNIVVIIDNNGLQYDGNNEEIMNLGNISKRWHALGFDVVNVDGHNTKVLCEKLGKIHTKPLAVIAKTVKGKGVSFAENIVEWHTGRLTEELYLKALEDLSI